jgi:hypothetical protein
MDLLLPQHARLRVNIDEVLDLALIEQQAEHGCLDFRNYADFVVDKMAMLCAPVRDEQIAGLRKLNDIVDLYRCAFVFNLHCCPDYRYAFVFSVLCCPDWRHCKCI